MVESYYQVRGGESMELFNKEYILVIDNLNVKVTKNSGRIDKENKPVYETICYASTLEYAFKFLIEEMMKNKLSNKQANNVEQLKEILAEIRETKREISEQISKLK